MSNISGVKSKRVENVSQGTTDVTRIYPKCDEKVEKNECKDEKVTVAKFTHALRLIFIFSKFRSRYRIIIHCIDIIIFRNSAEKSIEI